MKSNRIENKDYRPQPRWWWHLKAILGGYFWLPCPICGENFGGNEPNGSLYTGGGSGWSTCLNCAKEAQKRSDEVHKSEGVISISGRML